MMNVVYISTQFPTLTKTFIYREVLALMRLGLNVRAISTWRPAPASVAPEAAELAARTFYLFPLPKLKLVQTHLRYLLTRPARYLGALARLTLFNRETLRNRARSLGHFVYGVWAAAEVERCDAQHIHADFAHNAASVALVAAHLTRRPFSFTAHANDVFANPILLPEKLRWAKFAVPISEFNRRHLLSLSQDPHLAERLPIVHYGLDLRQFEPRPITAPSNTPPVILAVGRLVEKKGFHVLVAACAELKQRGVAFECRIVGAGPEESRLRHLIEAAHLTEQVHLLGAFSQEQVRAAMQAADVFTLPCVVARDADQDGIPNVLIEAMALAVPVISTPVSGIPELIQDGVNGLLVPSAEAPALADGLQRLLGERALAARLALAGRATVERDFNIDRNAQRLADLFQQAITAQ